MTTVPEQYITNRPSGIIDYLHTFTSLIPKFSNPTVASIPEIGSPAPSKLGDIDLAAPGSPPTLVAFVRHCGCPFAEQEVRRLGEASESNASLRIIIVQHSSLEDTQAWFERIGGHTLFPNQSRVHLVPDVNRELYAQWGIGQLPWGKMVNGEIMHKLHQNKIREGLDITKSDFTSYRWQNSGGFAVDGEGKVRWRKVAADSSDVCDYAEAAKTLIDGHA